MKITYTQSGVNYESMDPIKKLAQEAGLKTAGNLLAHGYSEITATRGESAYVWKQGNVLMASVLEGLGTKNMVADEMRKIIGKTYYDVIGHDAIAASINDLITVGATPLVLHAYWAVGDSTFFDDYGRMRDLVKGWKVGCDLAGVSWGGGETPTYKGMINPRTIELGSSAVGVIKNKKNLIVDKNIRAGDRILLIKSNGININGLSLARAVAAKLPKKYATALPGGKMFGEALLTKTNIYAGLVAGLQKGGIDIHYISNITGHGFRKIMRGRPPFTYVIEKLFSPQKVFDFLQKHAYLSDKEMFGTFNMGMDYAIFLPKDDIGRARDIVRKAGFDSIDAGYVEKGKKKVVIEPKDIVFDAESLDLR